jgi:hypothetical protein
MSRSRRLVRLLAVLPLALSCSGCLLVAYGLPGDKYETHLVFWPTEGGVVSGDLMMSVVGRDVVEIEGELDGLEPGSRYQLRNVDAKGCNDVRALVDALPAHAQPMKVNAIDQVMLPYIGPVPQVRADAAGKLHVDVQYAGNVFGGGNSGPSRWVLVREGQATWAACGQVNTIKVRDAWGGHPKM